MKTQQHLTAAGSLTPATESCLQGSGVIPQSGVLVSQAILLQTAELLNFIG